MRSTLETVANIKRLKALSVDSSFRILMATMEVDPPPLRRVNDHMKEFFEDWMIITTQLIMGRKSYQLPSLETNFAPE